MQKANLKGQPYRSDVTFYVQFLAILGSEILILPF